MYAIIWEYEVKPEEVDRFSAAYGAQGAWASLFAQAEGFVGVDLYRAEGQANRFVTIDRWRSREAFLEFMTRFAAAYEALDRSYGALTLAETRLGEFGG